MKNHQILLKQLQSYTKYSSNKTSRNNSNNHLQKKTNQIKSAIISRKPSNSKVINNNFTYSHIIIHFMNKNLIKHNSTPEKYNKHVITNIIFDEKKHCVSDYKNYLIWDETAEFLKRYYNSNEATYRIPKISSYYEKYTLFNPNHFASTYSVVKIMNKLIKKKRKYLEFLETNEENINNNKQEESNKQKIHSKVIKESLLRSRSLISSIDGKPNETIALSKIDNIDNSNLSFNDLIDKSTLYVNPTELTVKPKKMILKKISANKITEVSLKSKTKKINMNNYLNKIMIENSNVTQSKKMNKVINCIPYISNSTNLTTNNSIVKHNANSANKGCFFTSRKIKNKEEFGIQNKMNVNVNLNINLNINIQNKPNKANKLVLTTQKNNLKRKIVIEETNVVKLSSTNYNNHTNNNKRNTNNAGLKKTKIDYINNTYNNQKSNDNAQSHQSIRSLLSKNTKTENNPIHIPDVKRSSNNGIINKKMKQIKYRNQPLTSRGTDKDILSIDLLAKLINSQQKVIKQMKSQNTSKERKTLN